MIATAAAKVPPALLPPTAMRAESIPSVAALFAAQTKAA
jgi:hypothetical protein